MCIRDRLDQSLPGTVIGMGFACKDELYRIFRIIHDSSKSVYILSLIHILTEILPVR